MNEENKNKSDSEFSLRWSKKIKAIRMLGNKCSRCGNDNIFQLEFHHTDEKEKEFDIGNLSRGRWSKVEREIKKCILVCRNCHAELHYTRKNVLKEKLLDIKGQKRCIECGYNKSTSALDFHHINDVDKHFGIARGYREDRWKIPLEKIIVEMEKCNVICRNCHVLKNINIDRFEKLRKEIYFKADNHNELTKPANRSVVKKMIQDGYGVCYIAKEMGYSKGTISLIKKSMKL